MDLRGFAALGLGAAVFSVSGGGHHLTRAATPLERKGVVATVKETWSYEQSVPPYPGFHHAKGSPPMVTRVVVSRRDERYALAATKSAFMLLQREPRPYSDTGWLDIWDGAEIANACTAATPVGVRDLVCPSPWRTLGYAPPRLHLSTTAAFRTDASDVHRVDWERATVPGAVCGAASPIHLRRTAWGGSASADVRSLLWPWWPRVDVFGGQVVSYGDVTGDGRDEAAIVVDCSNGGGTADGQLAFAAVVYSLSGRTVRALGIVTPQQPYKPPGVHVPLLQVTLRPGEVVAHEAWYGPHDGTCCSSGRATTVWRYRNGLLVAGRTVVTRKPR